MHWTRTFTFLVGPEGQKFVVPQDVISKASPVLDRLMNVPMQEAEQKTASLQEVDPGTFEAFLAYACFDACASRLDREDDTTIQHFSKGKFIERLVNKGHDQTLCKGCRKYISLRRSLTFPMCQTCYDEPAAEPYSRCIIIGCGASSTGLVNLICCTCARNLDISTSQSRLIDVFGTPPCRFEDLASFCFDISILARETARLIRRSEVPPKRELPCQGLLQVGRLAIFAHIYGVDELSKVTCLDLYEGLAVHMPDQEGAGEVVAELAQLVYEGIPDSQEGDRRPSYLLRRMVSEWLAVMLAHFTTKPHLLGILAHNPDLVTDVMIAVGKEKAGRKL